jgi:hypothetical protein
MGGGEGRALNGREDSVGVRQGICVLISWQVGSP